MTLAEPLSIQINALMYGVATVAFLSATVKAARNYKKTKGISNYWLIFAIAMGLGTLFTIGNTFKYLGVAPVLLDQLDRWFAILFLFTLIITAIETLTSNIEVTIE